MLALFSVFPFLFILTFVSAYSRQNASPKPYQEVYQNSKKPSQFVVYNPDDPKSQPAVYEIQKVPPSRPPLGSYVTGSAGKLSRYARRLAVPPEGKRRRGQKGKPAPGRLYFRNHGAHGRQQYEHNPSMPYPMPPAPPIPYDPNCFTPVPPEFPLNPPPPFSDDLAYYGDRHVYPRAAAAISYPVANPTYSYQRGSYQVPNPGYFPDTAAPSQPYPYCVGHPPLNQLDFN